FLDLIDGWPRDVGGREEIWRKPNGPTVRARALDDAWRRVGRGIAWRPGERVRPPDGRLLMTTVHRLKTIVVTWTAAIFLLTNAGCPGTPGMPGGSGGPTMNFLNTTGAVKGGKGRVRVFLIDPAESDFSVALTSSHPTIAAVPASATFVKGSLMAEVEYDALSAGTAMISANLDDDIRMTGATVVPSLQFTSLNSPGTLQVGSRASMSGLLNITTP